MNVMIFGTKQIAELAHFYFTNDSVHEVIGFCVDAEYKTESTFCNLPVHAFEELDVSGDVAFFVAVADNELRAKKFEQLKGAGFKFVSYVSSKATCFADKIGDNCFILENNVIQPFISIGDNNILWSGNHIGHHSTIEDHVFISSHVVVCGNCRIGSYSWLGVNCSIRDGIELAPRTTVFMDTMIRKNTKENTKYFGVPGKEHGL